MNIIVSSENLPEIDSIGDDDTLLVDQVGLDKSKLTCRIAWRNIAKNLRDSLNSELSQSLSTSLSQSLSQELTLDIDQKISDLSTNLTNSITQDVTTKVTQNITPLLNLSKPKIIIASYDACSRSKDEADLVCDGFNDQDEILTVIESLPRGGRVQLSEDTFRVSRPVDFLDHDAISLCGVGPGVRSDTQPEGLIAVGTRIQAASDFSAGDNNYNAIIRIWHSSENRCLANPQVRDLSVDGNKTASLPTGIYFSSHRGLIDNVSVSLCGSGIYTAGEGSWSTFDTMYSRIWVDHNSGIGIEFGPYSFDNMILQAVIFANGSHGIKMGGSSHQFTSIHTYSNAGHNFWFPGRGTGTKIVNWKCENAGMNGIFVDSSINSVSNLCISNFNMKNNSSLGDNLYSDILIGADAGFNASNNSFTNGTFFNIQSNILPKYNVECRSKSQDNSFIGMTYANGASRTSYYFDMGVRNIIGGGGANGGTPGITGSWTTNPKEGAIVKDTINNLAYLYIRGSWLKIT